MATHTVSSFSSANYPSGVSQRDIDRLCPGSCDRYSADICPTCKREMEERYTDIWFVGDNRMPGGPIEAPNGEGCCSQKCLSQYVYSLCSEPEKELLRAFARVANTWSEETRVTDAAWCLRHSGIAWLIDARALRAVDTEMKEFTELLTGDDEAPAWYLEAAGLIAPRISPAVVTLGGAA